MGFYDTSLEFMDEYGVPRQGGMLSLEGRPDLCLSTDPARSDVLPHLIEVTNVDELKRIGGLPDEQHEHGEIADLMRIPGERTAARAAEVGDPNAPDVCAAHIAYLYGDSARVAHYRDVLNALLYPMQVAVFYDKNLEVKGKLVITSPDGKPVALVCETVTVWPQGQIVWETSGSMTASEMVFQSAQGAEPGVLVDDGPKFVSRGAPGGDGSDGASYPNPASNGSDGGNGRDDGKNCGSQPGPGQPGSPGTGGGNATGGGSGGASSPVTGKYDILNGSIPVGSSGGGGGKGGNGGVGQAGGRGGNSGAVSSHCGSRPPGGTGDDGGKGGDGGQGGDCGPGADIYITYTMGTPTFQLDPSGSSGGKGGVGGISGNGGQGGDPGGKNGLTPTTSGASKGPGGPGKAGTIFINGQALKST